MKYVWFVRGEAHAMMCETSMAAARRVDSRAECHVYTDDPALTTLAGGGTLHAMESGLPIMMANLEAQVRAIYDTKPGEHLAFLDTDVLLLERPLSDLFQYDLAVTWRAYSLLNETTGEPIIGNAAQQPYNYGVLMARAGLPAVESFLWMRERVRRMSTQLKNWYGNQLALAALAGPRPERGSQLDERAIPWSPTERGNKVRILKVPCEQWNYTPQKPGENMAGRGALHFKGVKRPLMEVYAKAMGLPWREAQVAA